jgi:hypothetical protein
MFEISLRTAFAVRMLGELSWRIRRGTARTDTPSLLIGPAKEFNEDLFSLQLAAYSLALITKPNFSTTSAALFSPAATPAHVGHLPPS